MTPRATTRMPLAVSLVVTLLAGTLGGATPAVAAEPQRVELAGTTLPALIADASGVVLAAARDGHPLDPAATVFTAIAGQEVISRIALDTTAVPAGTTLDDAQLRHTVISAPDGATVAVQTIGAGATRTDWPIDTPLPLTPAAPADLALTFSNAGTYIVTVTATMRANTAPAPAPTPTAAEDTSDAPATVAEPTAAPVALTTSYTFDIGASATPDTAVSPDMAASPEPGTTGAEPSAAPEPDVTAEQGASQPQAPQAPATTSAAIVSTGDIRVTTSVEGGELVQSIEDFTDDPKGTPLDLASTVFSVPTAEAWPGGNDGEDPDLWGRIVPDRGPVWRTAAGGIGANALALSLDSSAVPFGAVYGNPYAFDEGGIHSRLGSISGPGAGALLTGGTSEWGSSIQTGSLSFWNETGPVGDFGFVPSQAPFASAFTAPGRYCVTLETFAQRAGTGTVLNSDVTLTFAVGDLDPATVEPCAQPEPIPSQAPVPVPAETSATTVIDSGVALLGSTVTDGALSLDVVTTDRGRTTAYDPAAVVFSLPNRDGQWPGTPYSGELQENWARMVAEGTRPWRTTGHYPSAFTGLYSLDRQANPLALDLEARFIDAAALSPETSEVAYEFTGASTTSPAGYFATYRADTYEGAASYAENVAFWDSRSGGDRTDQNVGVASENGDPFYTPHKDRSPGFSALGTVFSEAGVYCVSVRTSAVLADGTPVEDRATFTFAVGVDASTVTPCSQESGEPGGGGGGGEPGDLDPTVTWMQQGHVDLALRENGDGLAFATGDPSTVGMIPLEDAVWVGRGSYATFTVREPSDLDDRTFIGEVGSTYYGFTQAGTSASRTLWPGLSMLYLPEDLTDRPATWTFSKVTGPGDVFAWTSDGNIYLDSRTQTSTSIPIRHTHVHENWAFTEPGVYCLAVSARLRAAADETTDRSAASLLTVAVGDVDLSTVQPCERTEDPPPAPAPVPVMPADDRAVIGAAEATRGLELASVNGAADVVASVTDSIGAAPRHTNVEKVIFTAREVAGRYQLDAFRWTTLLHERGGSDVTVTLGDVSGPGDYYLTGNRNDHLAPQFDTRANQERARETLWPGYLFSSSHFFTAQGVYCVPFTWSGRTADGTAFEVTKTLTFAAGADPATVTPCADGGEGTDPGGGGGGEIVWDVPNRSVTDSGATIVNVGHVDVASRIDEGKLRTVIKDDSDGTVYRAPGRTVLQVLPSAELEVPDVDAFRFLGAPGAPIWIVEEVQQEGLLWPGWSTELIDYGVIPSGVDWRLDRVQGPGEFTLFQTGMFGEPHVLLNTKDGVTDADRFTIPEHVHAHGSWAFSAEGVYCLAFTRSATLANGAQVSDDFTLVYAVGEVDVRRVNPAGCFTDEAGKPDMVDKTPVDAAELTEANAGEVQVLGGDDGFSPGQLVTAQVGPDRAGEWVSVWLHSAPQWLGWAQIGPSGAIQVRLPADATLGAHRLVVKTTEGDLIGWDSLSIVTAGPAPTPPATAPGGGTPAAVQVAATQCVAGATILSSGHVDYASRIVGGQLQSLVGDDTSGSKVYREPAGTILWLKPSSRVTLPAGYGQVGAAGANVWQVPQTQNPDLIWLGWSTEALNAGNTRGPVSWTIDSISGPGSVKAYLAGSFGGVQSMVFDNGGSYSIPLGVHAHANWAFSAEGIYRITTTQTATLANGQVSSDTETLTIVVGDVDPASAAGSGSGCGTVSNALLLSDDAEGARLAADQAAADAADAARTVLPGQPMNEGAVPTDPLTALSQGNPVPLLLSILGVLLLVGAGGAGVLWWRRRPRDGGQMSEVAA